VGLEIRVDGASEWQAAAEAMLARVREATDAGVDAGLSLIQAGAQQNLAHFSHPPGTPTPSAPGDPPALISGALRRSIRVRRTKRGPDRYEGRVGPTIVYGRIQELGGQLGHNPRHGMWRTPGRLPPRPYLAPAVFNAAPKVRKLLIGLWSRAIKG
jgi:hypothetical protein